MPTPHTVNKLGELYLNATRFPRSDAHHCTIRSGHSYSTTDDEKTGIDRMHTFRSAKIKKLYQVYKRRCQSGEKVTQAALAEWAEEHFWLNRVLNRSSISRILHDRPKLMTNNIFLLPTAKRNRSAVVSRLEKELFKRVCARNDRGVALNGKLVVMQAQKPFLLTNEHLPYGEKRTIQFPNR